MSAHVPDRSHASRDVIVSGRAKVSAQLVVADVPRAVVVVADAGTTDASCETAHAIARRLRACAEVATIALDLLASGEHTDDADTGVLRHHVPLLAERMSGAADFARQDEATRHLPLVFFAVGAAVPGALLSATSRSEVRAVVACSGRPDLAGEALDALRTPTLLVVGESDDALLALNRSARSRLRGESELCVVPAGGPRAGDAMLDEIVKRACAWLEPLL